MKWCGKIGRRYCRVFKFGFESIDMDEERYNRHIILPEIGFEGQLSLNNARVLVVGAGGLGSPVLMYLAAAGIGTIGIVDNDRISLSNLQRQVLYSFKDIGLPKAEMAKERLLENNPEIMIKTYCMRFSFETGEELIRDYDILVDCTDNYDSRYLIDEASRKKGIPMVYGSISKFTGQVSVFNYMGSKSYRELFNEKPQVDENDPTRLGVLGVLPGIIGSVQANEVIKIVLKYSGVLKNKLFLLDSKTMETQLINF